MATSAYYLDRVVELVRRFTDEPSVDGKYDDAQIIELVEHKTQEVLCDINSVADNPILVRHNLTFADGSTAFQLPPNVEQILRIAKLSTVDGLPEWRLEPRGLSSWLGNGIRLEGRTLRLDPLWQGEGATVELMYVPNGDFRWHRGALSNIGDGTVVTLAASATLGTIDTRANAYVGAVLRIISSSESAANFIQERTITGYVNTTKVVTVDMAFDPVLSGTVQYEVVPQYGRLLEAVIARAVSLDLLAVLGSKDKYSLLEREQMKAKRALLLQLARMQNITGDRFEHRSYTNER